MKLLGVALCFCALLMFAGSVSAQVPEKDSPVERANPQQIQEISEVQKVVPNLPAPNAETATKVKLKKLSGTVVSIDALANTMVVKGKKDSVTFLVDPYATIMWEGNTAKLVDIPKDGKIVVMYKMDGKMKVATSVVDQRMKAQLALPPKTEAPTPPAKPSNY